MTGKVVGPGKVHWKSGGAWESALEKWWGLGKCTGKVVSGGKVYWKSALGKW